MLLCSIATNRVLNNQKIYCCNRPLPVLLQKKLTDCCNPLLCLSQTTMRQLKAIKFRLVPVIIFSNLHNSVKWQSRELNEVLNKQLLLIFWFLRSNHRWVQLQLTRNTKTQLVLAFTPPALSYSLLCSPSQTNYRTRNFLFIDKELRVTTSYALPRLDEECANCSS